MQTLERSIVYKWSKEDGGDVTEIKKNILDGFAMNVIYAAINLGHSEGKLSYYSPSTGENFYGFWYLNKEIRYLSYLPEWAKNQGESQ